MFFDLKWKNEFQKIYFIFHIWLLNWKKKNEKKPCFLNLFWFKINFKKEKSKFSNSFFDSMSKNEFQKIISFFSFGYEIEKWKIFKIRFVFKSKNELYFRYMDYHKWFSDFQNSWTLKFKFEVCFSFFILIWKTKNQIYLNKYLMKLVTIPLTQS